MFNSGQQYWALKYDLHNQLLLWNFFDLAGIITELGIPYIIVSSEIVPLNSHHCPIFGIEPYNTLQSSVGAFIITAAKGSALQGLSSTGTTPSTPSLAPTAQ